MSVLDRFMDSVSYFHQTFKQEQNAGLYCMLLQEELGELAEAILKDQGPEKVASEWADCLFVLFGLAINSKIDLIAGMERVIAKNNAKIVNKDNLRRSETGKILKEGD